MDNKNVLLIVNPVAGRRMAQVRMFRIVDVLSKSGCKTTVFTTSKKGDATEIVKKYGSEAQKIICCGGDGTFNEVINGLAVSGLQTPIGYIPTGTTNDLAHAIGLPTQINDAIDIAINGTIREHDIGKFNGNKYFTYVASFGAFTKVAYDTPQWVKNTIGPVSYVINGVMQAVDIRPYMVEIIADDEEIIGDFVFGSVSNSTVVGGVVRFPESEIDFSDGEFEVMLVRNPTTPVELANVLDGLLNQKYDEESVYFFKASKLTFTFKECVQWTTDGEYAGGQNTVRIENIHRAVQISAP